MVALAAVGWFLAVHASHWFERAVLRDLVERIDSFKVEHGRLPTLRELKLDRGECAGRDSFLSENRCVFYRTHGDRYVVGYSVGPDEDVYFDSATGQWREGLSPSWHEVRGPFDNAPRPP